MLKSGFIRWLLLSLGVIAFDQASKIAILQHFMPYEVRPILPGFNLTLAFNPGAAFSFLANAGGWQKYFFTALALFVSAIIIAQLRKHHAQTLYSVAMSLIMGGAIGNVIDRLLYGHVVDFLDVYYGSAHWPAFNIADSAICLGAALMIIDSFKKPASGAQVEKP